MTHDKIKAIDELIAAAGEGTIARSDLDAFIPSLGLTTQANDAHSAYKGSLDAANALHKALLPRVMWQRSPNGQFCLFDSFAEEVSYANETDNPARAWLIAILKAYRSTLST